MNLPMLCQELEDRKVTPVTLELTVRQGTQALTGPRAARETLDCRGWMGGQGRKERKGRRERWGSRITDPLETRAALDRRESQAGSIPSLTARPLLVRRVRWDP